MNMLLSPNQTSLVRHYLLEINLFLVDSRLFNLRI